MADAATTADKQADWSDEAMLADLQNASFQYFMEEANPENGMIRDRNRRDAPASIAAIGMGLTALPVGVDCEVVSREEAARNALRTLRFLMSLPQGKEPDAAGYKGFFYHFLDIETGRRCWKCELSTIDTAILMAGVLTVRSFFDRDDETEDGIRDVADKLYRRVDWAWALNRSSTLALGWKPGYGFLRHRWTGYDESVILYVLAMGSPTFPIPVESYAARVRDYRWETVSGQDYFHAGPLFIHQMSHLWIDFRGIRDAPMREKGIDYFENSRRATYAQRQYAIDNPLGFRNYGENSWGITASDGPGPKTKKCYGVRRNFYAYRARGIAGDPDDGTISPWCTAASLPFAPEIVIPTIRRFHEMGLRDDHPYGFTSSFNPTFCEPGDPQRGWVAPDHIAINQGPLAIMIANYRHELVWRLTRACPYIVAGLRQAGFTGGWLDDASISMPPPSVLA